jgi:hypothetical protein
VSDLCCPIHHSQDSDRPRRPATGSLLCTGHIEQGRKILAALPDLDTQLAEIAAPTGARPSGSRNAEQPIPYHEKAADARTLMRATLVGRARIIAAERGVQLPTVPATFTRTTYGPACCQGRRHASCARIVAERLADQVSQVELACRFLAIHHDWCVSQPWADEYATELRDIEAEARHWLSKRPIGDATRVPCPNPAGCDGTLVAPFRDAELLNRDSIDSVRLVCPACGLQSRADRWLELSRYTAHAGPTCAACHHATCHEIKQGMQVLVTDQEAEIFTMSLGQRVSANTIRSWAHRGHIDKHDRDGRTYYDLEQIAARVSGKDVAA